MDAYGVSLFLHVVGAMGLFIAIGVELLFMFKLRTTTTVEVARAWCGLNRVIAPVFPIASVVLIASGLFMLHEQWGKDAAWANLALVTLIGLAIVGALFNAKRLDALAEAVNEAPAGPVPADVVRRVYDPQLWSTMLTMAALGVGIVFLMTVKPETVGSLVTLVIAAGAGMGAAQVVNRSPQPSLAAASE